MGKVINTPLAKRRRPCIRCGRRVTIGPIVLGQPIPSAREGGNIGRKGPNGAIFTFKGVYYCAACAPTVALCRVCGCTDEAGCSADLGRTVCHWNEPDLCSFCHDKLMLEKAGTAVPRLPIPSPLGCDPTRQHEGNVSARIEVPA